MKSYSVLFFYNLEAEGTILVSTSKYGNDTLHDKLDIIQFLIMSMFSTLKFPLDKNA